MSGKKPELNQTKPFSGMRVLVAVAIGCALGAAVAYFIKVLIDNSPAEIDLRRLRLHCRREPLQPPISRGGEGAGHLGPPRLLLLRLRR